MTDRASPAPRLETTGDGSHTLYAPHFDQHYHNPNGAVAENRHLFFEKNGLRRSLSTQKEMTIFETGFGTGLNLLLLLDYCRELESECSVDYYSVEGFPIDADTAESFNYGEYLAHPELADLLPGIFEAVRPGMNRFEPTEKVVLHLFIGMFNRFEPGALKADFILHDPFSPEVNEELWSGEFFRLVYGWCRPDAVLSTYCAASRARGAMAWAGWKVAREEGAPGQREMTLASPDPQKLDHLDRVNEKRLARRYEAGDF